jgi:hypothetical protein
MCLRCSVSVTPSAGKRMTALRRLTAGNERLLLADSGRSASWPALYPVNDSVAHDRAQQ